MKSIEGMLPLPPHTFHVLLVLRRGALHGYGIKKAVVAESGGRIDLDAGGLYRLIARLEAQGIVSPADAPADDADDERRRVYYQLTPRGLELLSAEARRLASLVASQDVLDLLSAPTRA